ncbi:MAG TPA: M23 family metallopeptidase, partial [Bacteroidales bacterium]|nr:M23 family metallopeptidase [Bacteroidales bacterium]
MQYKKLGLVIYFFSLFLNAFNQTKSDNFNFISPVDFPIYLSGNFGEIRAEHFHSGIDIKTQGVEGKKIFAIENGHISRIKISANGYGKTLYIEHPNGYTSVYAHLSRYNHVIDKIVKELQYENKTFEINYFPKPNQIPVKKGQVIAFSGNTGRSFGPHLHFEIRETNYQVPVNPLIFNFEIKDNIAPQINHVAIYPLGNNSKINHQHNKLIIPAIKSNGNYILQDTSLLLVEGNIGFGIELYDYLNGSNNKCGIYTLSLFIDSLLVYNHKVDKVTFGETAYVK